LCIFFDGSVDFWTRSHPTAVDSSVIFHCINEHFTRIWVAWASFSVCKRRPSNFSLDLWTWFMGLAYLCLFLDFSGRPEAEEKAAGAAASAPQPVEVSGCKARPQDATAATRSGGNGHDEVGGEAGQGAVSGSSERKLQPTPGGAANCGASGSSRQGANSQGTTEPSAATGGSSVLGVSLHLVPQLSSAPCLALLSRFNPSRSGEAVCTVLRPW
jgi:hypothetical protein